MSSEPAGPADEEKKVYFDRTKQLSASSSTSTLTMNSVYAHGDSTEKTEPSICVANDQDVEKCSDEPIPTKRGNRIIRFLRWNFFSTYRKLFTVVFLANIVALVVLASPTKGSTGLSYTNTVNATSVNLLFSILCRQEHLVNALFRATASIPIAAPFWFRRCMTEIYHYGGIHSGCGVAAVSWYLAFATLVTKHIFVEPYIDVATAVITWILLCLLLSMIATAHPQVRHRIHDTFEAIHRFAGWTVVALFWTQTFLTIKRTTRDTSSTYAYGVTTSAPFYCLVIVTLCIAYPWLRVRRLPVRSEPLSPHAIRLHFAHPTPSFCQALRLSTNPLHSNHAFAAIPSASGTGFSVVVSNAGNWTSAVIAFPPASLYIKGVPTSGVLRLATLFSPVLLVATGSGIAPLLSLFAGAPGLKCRVLWCTPDPVATFGKAIVNRVLAADPEAVIIDTRKSGRPDIVGETWRAYKKAGAEAVVVVSNPRVTRRVVYGMETRGVPAFAPIFDS